MIITAAVIKFSVGNSEQQTEQVPLAFVTIRNGG